VGKLSEQVAYYIGRLRGPDGEDAYHSLIEADDAVVPLLIEAFGVQKDMNVRAELVEIVWQHRLPETVGFLARALDDPAPEVWKSALDGLVALGGPSAVQALERARERAQPGDKADWIEEALEQIEAR
jgi:HEAT repeat protein